MSSARPITLITSGHSPPVSSSSFRVYCAAFATLAATAVFKMARASNEFPVPAGDGLVWIVAHIRNELGFGYTNPITIYPTSTTLADGAHSVSTYPPLHMFLTSALSQDGSVASALRSIAIIEILAATLLLISLTKIFSARQIVSNSQLTVVLCASTLAMSTLQFGGRPESTVCLLLALGVIIFQQERWEWRIPLLGVTLGFVAATNAMVGLIVASIISCAISYQHTIRETIKRNVLIAIISLASFALVLSSKYTLAESIQGISSNSPAQFVLGLDLSLFFQRQFLTKEAALAGLPMIWAAYLLLTLLCQWKEIQARWLFVLSCISLFGFLAIAVLFRPNCAYNSLALAPVLISFTAWRSINSSRWIYTSIAVFALASIGLVVQALGFGLYSCCAVKLAESRIAFQKVVDAAPSKYVGLDNSLWILAPDYTQLGRFYEFSSPHHAQRCRNPESWVVIQQAYRAPISGGGRNQLLIDQELGLSHEQVSAHLGSSIIEVSGRTFTPSGYGFAVYRPAAKPNNPVRCSDDPD